ncbi:hypothetical protein F5141DRAFT_1123608 [Pisolithus sp. B1]|nr:hypothetical protein F5141DRAFT_1123608 [Pisolithus sp. B1]
METEFQEGTDVGFSRCAVERNGAYCVNILVIFGTQETARSNPKTTRSGRKRTKNERRIKGRERDTQVPLMVKVKRALGIQSTPPRSKRRWP